MNSIRLSGITTRTNETASSMLNNVIADLKDKNDIEEAALVNRRGKVIARALPDKSVSAIRLSELVPRLLKHSSGVHNTPHRSMFTHLISEFKGRKVLARTVTGDLILLVLLQKSGYMSPVMLDMENSILRIREILSVHVP